MSAAGQRRASANAQAAWKRIATKLAALAWVTGPASTYAAPVPDDIARNVIAIEPLALVFARTIALEYERGIDHIGVHVSTALALGDFSISEPERSGDYLSIGFTLGVRVYPWTEAPRGPFFGPFATIAWIEAKSRSGDQTAETSGFGWAAGAMVGWTWVLGTSFVVSVGGGAAWYELSLDPDDTVEPSGRRGALPSLRLAVGAAF